MGNGEGMDQEELKGWSDMVPDDDGGDDKVKAELQRKAERRALDDMMGNPLSHLDQILETVKRETFKLFPKTKESFDDKKGD